MIMLMLKGCKRIKNRYKVSSLGVDVLKYVSENNFGGACEDLCT